MNDLITITDVPSQPAPKAPPAPPAPASDSPEVDAPTETLTPPEPTGDGLLLPQAPQPTPPDVVEPPTPDNADVVPLPDPDEPLHEPHLDDFPCIFGGSGQFFDDPPPPPNYTPYPIAPEFDNFGEYHPEPYDNCKSYIPKPPHAAAANGFFAQINKNKVAW
ncbi:MAG: hypothetical protein LBT73_01450 [Tannerellaceae bacterium]|nr:hypothetical protein [Tannerellaceae bacterium]